MNNALQRLYKTKLALLATIATVVGIALLMLSHWLSPRPGWLWPSELVNDIGASLFSVGLLGIFFQYIGAKDQERDDDDRVRRMLKETAPDMRDAVVDGFAFAPESLTSVASPETLDRIIENCLAIQLGDHELARDAYSDLREQVLRARPRVYDARVSAVLSPWTGGPESGAGSMFVATIRREYRTVPGSPVMRLACVSDPDEYRELLHDPTCAIVWHFRPVGDMDGSSLEAFQLLQFSVDGQQVPSRRAARGKGQVLTVNIGEEVVAAQKPVTLSYTYRTLVQQHGHLLHLDISHPTKGLHVEFLYKDCGIGYVNVLDYIAGAQQPQIAQLPADDPTPSVEINYDGWVFPKGGVALVWVLESELASRPSSKSVK
jgi:hypothetical protein